jgi:hypothetical protein
MNMHARESRFGVDIRSVTERECPCRYFLKWIFIIWIVAPLIRLPDLRHFYGVVGRLLVGRTWGTQSDLFAVPITIDFAAGDALTGTEGLRSGLKTNWANRSTMRWPWKCWSFRVLMELIHWARPAKIYRCSPVDSQKNEIWWKDHAGWFGFSIAMGWAEHYT